MIENFLRGRLLSCQEIKKNYPDFEQELNNVLLEKLEISPGLTIENQNVYCNRCANSRQKDFAQIPRHLHGGLKISSQKYYCLKCLNMGRITQDETLYFLPDELPALTKERHSQLSWQGTLSDEQARAAGEAIESLEDSTKPHMIHAVTGAGKTEMTFLVIDTVLRKGGRVAFASPRIDVCLELAPRLRAAFAAVPLTLLYGGSEEKYSYTPIIVATTHQLLRFKQAFDLLIVDEVDAFPYVSDESLHYAVKRAVKDKGKLIYLTATPDNQLIKAVSDKKMTQTILPARYHRFALPEPQFLWIADWREAILKRNKKSRLFKLLNKFLLEEGIKLVFMPNIKLAEYLFEWYTEEYPKVSLACVHAKDPKRKEKVQSVRNGQLEALITTTILERGVTFTNCHVLIIGAEDRQFSKSALVQMSGRVGRKSDYPTGRLIFGHYGISKSMRQARKEIISMNQLARQTGKIEG